MGGRDFEKKKYIIAGIYSKDNPNRLVGLAEIVDYKKRENEVTVGYRLNEDYWNKKIATNILKIMVEYLTDKIRIITHQKCYCIMGLQKKTIIRKKRIGEAKKM